MPNLFLSLSLWQINQTIGFVAQLYRAPHYGCGGLRLESLRGHSSGKLVIIDWFSAFFVVELPETGIVGCGRFYIVKDKNEARLAWGMIHSNLHKQGYGTALYNYRKEIIKKEWPNHIMVLGTSQHTYSFYEKMGMTITANIKAGYGPDLDKYDMTQ